jgi:ribonuclease BN (tRNA processing enzyme)
VELKIVGSASAEPNPGSAASCYLIDAGAGQLVLECGHGAAAKLLLYTSVERIGAILISHMHPDHFFDLMPMRYLITFNGYRRLPLYVPPAGPKVLSRLAEALGDTPDFWEDAYDIRLFDPRMRLEALGMTITMSPSHHFIPAWAMRFASAESVGELGYTSDTALTDSVTAHMSGVDLLLAESSIEIQTKPENDRGHLTGAEAGLLARRAGAKRLVLTHYPHTKAAAMRRAASESFGENCDLAIEGKGYTIR